MEPRGRRIVPHCDVSTLKRTVLPYKDASGIFECFLATAGMHFVAIFMTLLF